MALKITRASDNVFRDLGFTEEEAEHLRLRSDLMMAVGRAIERRGLTQAAAARLLGVSQPRVSDLVRGKLHLFSVESLVQMLTRAGVHVALTVGSDELYPAALSSLVESGAAVSSLSETAAAGQETRVEVGLTVGPWPLSWAERLFAASPAFCAQAS